MELKTVKYSDGIEVRKMNTKSGDNKLWFFHIIDKVFCMGVTQTLYARNHKSAYKMYLEMKPALNKVYFGKTS